MKHFLENVEEMLYKTHYTRYAGGKVGRRSLRSPPRRTVILVIASRYKRRGDPGDLDLPLRGTRA